MKTKLSLEKERYQFIIDGGLAGIIFISLVASLMELISIFWSNLNNMYAPIGTTGSRYHFWNDVLSYCTNMDEEIIGGSRYRRRLMIMLKLIFSLYLEHSSYC